MSFGKKKLVLKASNRWQRLPYQPVSTSVEPPSPAAAGMNDVMEGEAVTQAGVRG